VDASPPESSVSAGDLCACNQILDEVARKLLRKPFDEGGAAAMSGTVHEEAMIDLEGVLAAQVGVRRSLGTGDEASDWVSRWRLRAAGEDLARTACEVIGATIGETLRDRYGDPARVYLAGGGARNAALVSAIRASTLGEVAMFDTLGTPGAFREAACFAVLGALCADRVPITLASVTGVTSAPVSGSWVLP
jgi:anhydro-N-acetylmuramic acid kinase